MTGLMLHAIVHAADIQDRDGGMMLMATLFGLYPFLLKLYADGGYQGPQFQRAMHAVIAQIDVEIVKRSDKGKRCFGTLGRSVGVWWHPVPGHQFVDAILRPAVHQPGE
jgi:hypothetical protein